MLQKHEVYITPGPNVLPGIRATSTTECARLLIIFPTPPTATTCLVQ